MLIKGCDVSTSEMGHFPEIRAVFKMIYCLLSEFTESVGRN